MIEKNDILNGLETEKFGRTIFSFNSLDSTNIFAKSLPKNEAPHGTIIIAEEQTAGRGRMERAWKSEKNNNLLFSIIIYPDFRKEKVLLLPFAAALALCDGIEEILPYHLKCKWPNDVLVRGKKVSGILLESVYKGMELERIIIGIGVNVNQNNFPEELRHKATSLKNESGKDIDRLLLLRNILRALEFRYVQLSEYPVQFLLKEWKMKNETFGKRITIFQSDFSFEATMLDVAEDGSLLVELNDGSRKNIYAGDVTLQENYSPNLNN
ncbi:MAG: biotin--[acetyl-CoA-carboxylase] ligase [Bacteroidetes bacterium]|nr:biotin--[acetyl-CoA-carboxylase] ligase [Bacteroidota bacterium]